MSTNRYATQVNYPGPMHSFCLDCFWRIDFESDYAIDLGGRLNISFAKNDLPPGLSSSAGQRLVWFVYDERSFFHFSYFTKWRSWKILFPTKIKTP